MTRAKNHGHVVFVFFKGIVLILLLMLYFVAENEIVKIVSISLFGLGVITMGLYLTLRGGSHGKRIKKNIERLESIFTHGSLDVLKKEYHEIYGHYMKLTEKEKQNFYHLINGLRERIEHILKAAKKIELLLLKAGQGTIEKQKERYHEMNAHYRKLPKKEQEKFYSHLLHVKERLEGARR